MRVLVLGASGFIGGAIVRGLVARGDVVTALTRGDVDLDASVSALPGDLGDPPSVAEAARGCDVVISAAGICSPRASRRALQWTHVAGAENVLNACRHAGVSRLVWLSCSDVTLGNVDRIHWDEKQHLSGRPVGERARTLQLAEEVALSAAGLEVTSLRPAWVWGPGDTSRLPGLCREARAGGIRLVGDGRNYLSTTYIDHLVAAALRATEAENVAGRAFHVADAVFQHARDFFFALSDRLQLPSPRRGLPLSVAYPLARVGVRVHGLTDAELLQRGRSTLFDFNAAIGTLDYDPSVSLDDGLAALSAWVDAQGGVDAVATLERPAPDDRSVDAQVEAAGGD